MRIYFRPVGNRYGEITIESENIKFCTGLLDEKEIRELAKAFLETAEDILRNEDCSSTIQEIREAL